MKHRECYDLLWKHVMSNIRQELEIGLRDVGDWSLEAAPSCHCADCNVIKSFLQCETESKKSGQLLWTGRNHIMEVYEKLDLPVKFSVEKKGSPHQLVIDKHSNLYQLAKARFEQLQMYCKKLEEAITRHDVPRIYLYGCVTK